MKTTISETPAPDEGHWHCQRCKAFVTPSEHQLAAAENAPLFSQAALKCPHCHHHTVKFHLPTPVKTKTQFKTAQRVASAERVKTDDSIAAGWFAKMRAAVHS